MVFILRAGSTLNSSVSNPGNTGIFLVPKSRFWCNLNPGISIIFKSNFWSLNESEIAFTYIPLIWYDFFVGNVSRTGKLNCGSLMPKRYHAFVHFVVHDKQYHDTNDKIMFIILLSMLNYYVFVILYFLPKKNWHLSKMCLKYSSSVIYLYEITHPVN